MRKFINDLGNRFMPWLLRSRLHRLVSGSILLITFTGRKSGQTYTTPVQYMQQGSTLTVFTQRRRVWWKNLRGGAPVTLLLRGQPRQATAYALTIEDDAARMRAGVRRMYPRMSPGWQENQVRDAVIIEIRLDDADES
jgi:deazaflavin-dependent oxidoreductase (nitroreductase family)